MIDVRTGLHFHNHLQSLLELLGWKLSPVVFYHQLTLRNTTRLSFQLNTSEVVFGLKCVAFNTSTSDKDLTIVYKDIFTRI